MDPRSRPGAGALRRAGRFAAAIGAVLLLAPLVQVHAAESVAQYEGRAEGSIMRFSVHMPETGVPITVTGGAFDSTVLANSLPEGLATAGTFPVPAASSFPLLVPQETPAPIRDALRGQDYSNTPNYCQAAYPPAKPGLDEGNCGGPRQVDSSAPFTAAFANGHAKVTGNLDQPLETRSVAESTGAGVTIPALQVALHHLSSQAVSGLNSSGAPQSESRAEVNEIDLLEGKVTLGDILSQTTVVNDGTPAGQAAKTAFSLGSATVMGVPVHIGPDGFVVASQSTGADSTKSLTDALDKSANVQGFSMRVFPARPVTNANGLVTAESGGVEVSYLADKPVPAFIVQRYGYTSASMSALTLQSADETGGDTTFATTVSSGRPHASAVTSPETVAQPPAATSGSPVADGDLAPEAPPSSSSGAGDQQQGAAAAGGAAATGAASGDQAHLGENLLAAQHIDAGHVRTVYLVLAICLVAFPVAFRLRRAL